jgi:RNA polymerase sigma factor (sigma-70 family)
MEFDQMTDQELIRVYGSGEEKGFATLLGRYQSKIYTSIYLLVKDHDLADDLFQETFIKVIQTLRRKMYLEEGKFLPWVMRIAHNLVIDHFRKQKKQPILVDIDMQDRMEGMGLSDESFETRMIHAQTMEDLRACIRRLPDEQKEVLIMRHYGEMSFKEIAEVTDVSINTALGRMRYAISNLRKMITDRDQLVRLTG